MSELNEAHELSPAARGWLTDTIRKQSEKKRLDEEIDLLKEKIKAELLDNPIGSINGQPVVTWKAVESSRFDLKKGKELIDATILANCYTTSSVKTFRIVDAL